MIARAGRAGVRAIVGLGMLVACAAAPVPPAHAQNAPPVSARLELRPGDRVILIGNTLAERQQLFNHFETLLMTRLPELRLVVRNLGWSGDTLTLQPRPLNFGDAASHLREQKADVILAFFGLNESFAGEAGLPRFEQDLDDYLRTQLAARYNDREAPRLALISPIAHERLARLPRIDTEARNAMLARYTETMRTVAGRRGVPFVDLFTPTRALMARASDAGSAAASSAAASSAATATSSSATSPAATSRSAASPSSPRSPSASSSSSQSSPSTTSASAQALTINGIHLDDYGDRLVAGLLMNGLGLETAAMQPPAGAAQRRDLAALRELIRDKNQQFFYRWRPVNAEYIVGRRVEPFGSVNFPKEMAQIDQMVGERDRAIWKRALALKGVRFADDAPAAAPVPGSAEARR